MKILEISLHNINSLKSASPIVVDFTSDFFKDVGLYAITGVTGAGKTTLLDAITIALYNQVPRFNNVAGSRGLENVVSYGATNAFSRVVFKNGTDIYEAYWGMSLVTKTGKKRTTPEEKVSFKNLTTGKILGEKKREVKEQVELVTALNYDQFLRSVLLAQGEFAAFLTAKGPDKAKLLEQITGEQIYKRIGETIQRRKSEETRRLDDLKLTIDNKNLLTEEELVQKKNDLTATTKELEKIEVEEESYQKIETWYKDDLKLKKEEDDLITKKESLEKWVVGHQQNMDLLTQDEQALPFKELLNSLEKEDKLVVHQKAENLKNNQELSLVYKEIEKQSELLSAQKIIKETAEKVYKDWEPKLSKVTTLDTEMASVLARYKIVDKQQKEKVKEVDDLQLVIKKTNVEFDKIKTDIVPLELYLHEHKIIPTIEESLSDWNGIEVEIGKDKEQFDGFVTSKNKLKLELVELQKQQKIFLEKSTTLEVNYQVENKALEILETELKSNNLKDLLATKDVTSKKLTELKEFKTVVDNFVKNKKEQEGSRKLLQDLEKEIENLNKEIVVVEKEEKAFQQSVSDAETIYKQESLIINLSKERDALVAGEPCKVCGSLEHPFVETYKDKSISESEKELTLRKQKLAEVTKNLHDLKGIVASKKPMTTHYSSQINHLEIEEKEFLQFKENSAIAFQLTEEEKIIEAIKNKEEILSGLNSNIELAQKQVETREKLSKAVNDLLANVNLLKSELTTVNTNEINKKEALIDVEKSVELTQKRIELQINELNISLKEKNLVVPESVSLKEFLHQLKQEVQQYKIHQEQLTEKLDRQKIIEVEQENRNTNLENNKEYLKNIFKELDDLKDDYKQKELDRIAILPKDISVTEKRNALEKDKTTATQFYDAAVKKESELKNTTITLSTRIHELENQIKTLENSLGETKNSINSKLETSELNTIEDVKKALLQDEERVRFKEIEKTIHDKSLQLKTWFEVNEKAKTDLEKEKNFEMSFDEVSEKLKEIKTSKISLSETKGKIQEQFETNKRIKFQNKEVVANINKQEKEVSKWSKLLKVLGGSKDAFNTYVQRLTLKSLIDLANIHLYKLNKRYSLQLDASYAKGEELSFKLMDHYQADQTRYVDTSSGGEKFLISLALALGLSDLASNNVKIESLFIDEGFGTLDGNTLETVVTTLENLQSQGKMIGVISHVESLKERISTQIQIHKKGEGISELKLVQ